MDRNNLILYINTIKYLKFDQVFYRIKNLFKIRPFRFSIKGTHLEKNLIIWNNYLLNSKSYLGNNKFKFLNLEVGFKNKINWNYKENGKLWLYNLNYFDYLNQNNFSKKDGLFLIYDFIKNESKINDGLDSYPISIRSINWIKFLSKNKINDPLINNILFKHVKYLKSNIEYHILGNHLLENAFALIFSGYYFHDKSLYNKGKEILFSELDEQILNDGGHFELSTMYHQIILYRLLDLIALINYNNWRGDNLISYLKKITSKMLSWLNNIIYDDMTFPMINDAADNICPSPKNIFDYSKKLKIPFKNIKLSESGFRKWRLGKAEILIDISSIKSSYIPAHSHADTFNFELIYDNKPIIIDPGVSTYENTKSRNNERSTMFHNTININSKSSSEIWSSFRIADRANVNVLKDENSKIVVSHDGYKKLKCVHKRTFTKNNYSFEITDLVQSKEKKIICQSNLHFNYNFKPILKNNIIEIDNLNIILINYIKPKLIYYNCPNGFNKYKKALKLVSNIDSSSKLIFKLK